MAAAHVLRERLPSLRVRLVDVVDLMGLPRRRDHPHGRDGTRFCELSTDQTDVVSAFHGCPAADRCNVRGLVEPSEDLPEVPGMLGDRATEG